jgi:cytochrome P450
MREKAPIYYSKTWRAYWVTRFDWAQEILKDKRFGANVRQFEERTKEITRNLDERRLERFNNPSMLDLDPPDHTRIRKLASQGFVHKFIQSLEPRIREIVHECLDPSGNAQTIDFVESLAKPLPAIVIAEMLGLPKEDHEQFASWSEDLMLGTSTNDADKLEKSLNANTELIDYFRRMAEIKRAKPGDDMLSRLIAAEEEGDSLSEAELYNNCVLLLVAGHETTTRLISNGLYLLLKNPEQMQQLRDDPTRIPQAIEEMLRFEPPVQATRRFALEDVEFNGTRFKRGDLVFLSIAGSNRDPLANESPDVFDISRDQPKLVSFGYGIHLCIGASLARLEAKVAFEEILNRYDALSLGQSEPVWGENAFFRGHEALNVKVSE